MNDVTKFTGGAVAKIFPDLAPIAMEHRWKFMDFHENDCHLLPMATVSRCIAELETALAERCPAKLALSMTRKLMAAYPVRAADTETDSAGYVALLVEELCRFPSWVVAEAVPEIWRTQKFRPAVSEVVQACQTVVSRAEAVRLGAKAMASRIDQAAEDRRRRQQIETELAVRAKEPLILQSPQRDRQLEAEIVPIDRKRVAAELAAFKARFNALDVHDAG